MLDIENATDAQEGGYDQLRVGSVRDEIAWLDGEVWALTGLEFGASVRIAYPFDETLPVRAWAWWTDSGAWVGPRHTNFGDGSVCAYELQDRTWDRGQALISYLDLISVWLARHSYLRTFDRWPGRQALHTARERLTEHQAGEVCGGCESGLLYEYCHATSDRRLSNEQVASEYSRRYGSAQQRPPVDEAGFERAARTRWGVI